MGTEIGQQHQRGMEEEYTVDRGGEGLASFGKAEEVFDACHRLHGQQCVRAHFLFLTTSVGMALVTLASVKES